MELPPAFGLGRLASTAPSLIGTLILLAVLTTYLVGVGRYRLVVGRRWSTKRSLSFVVGIAIVALATQSVVGVYDMTLFADHMVQHLLLIMIAAGFFAMAAPLELASETIPGQSGRLLNGLLRSRAAGVIGHPIVGFLLYAVFIPLTHLTGLFNLMLEHMWVHHLEQLGFLIIGYLFWRPVVGIEPSRHPLAPGLRLVYLALAVPVDTFTGLALVMAGHEPFSAYVAMHRSWGPSLLDDLKTGGSIMWIGGDLLMMLAMIPVTVGWVRDEEAKTKILDARLDAEAAAEAADAARQSAIAPPGSAAS